MNFIVYCISSSFVCHICTVTKKPQVRVDDSEKFQSDESGGQYGPEAYSL